MSNQITIPENTKKILLNPEFLKRLESILGTNAQGYATSVLSAISENSLLATANAQSILGATLTAASLKLPVNKNLGFAYFVPYKGECQLQIGYKGFVQLAQRTGLYKTIASTEIYEGQLVENNPLDGLTFDWGNKQSDKIVGYCAKFQLLNGFTAYHYMSYEEVTNHAKKYSQSYNYATSIWKKDFNSMAKKTVLKLLLSKQGPLSIDMELGTALQYDQAVVKNDDINYIDNTEILGTAKTDEVIDFINNVANDLETLRTIDEFVKTEEQKQAYQSKLASLTTLVENA